MKPTPTVVSVAVCAALSLTLATSPLSALAETTEAVPDSTTDSTVVESTDLPSDGSDETLSGEVEIPTSTGDMLSITTDSSSADSTEALEDDAGLSAQSTMAVTTASSTTQPINVVSLEGDTRYETAAEEAKKAYSNATTAILVTGENFPDALSATSLAGALDAPILYVRQDEVPEATVDALQELGVEEVYIIGSEAVVGPAVVSQLGNLDITVMERLYGDDRYGTQMAIYEYGLEHGYWTGDSVVVATGENFPDALSISPYAFKTRTPIFLAGSGLALTDEQYQVLGGVRKAVIVGSTVVVSSETESVLEGIADGNNGGNVDNVIRLSGATRFETSAAIAEWEVDGEGFTWDKAAFARGDLAFDALAGSVLQGRGNSVLLLIDDSDRVTADTLGSNASAVAEVRFFGSRAAVSTSTRNYVLSRLGANIEYRNFNVSLSELARIESQLPYSGDYGYQAYYDILDPDNADYMFGNSEFYQFAVLNEYTDDVTAAQLNAYIANQVAYNEGRYGVTSVLRGQGQAFIDAARRWNVNVVYLLSHAAYESAWGCSSFAQGTVTGYGGYYNLFGIRCFNSNPSVGAQYAKDRGWDTVSKAIDGGAQWISNGIQLSNGVDGGYLNRYGQNTLYLMKWDLFNMEDSNDPWHQYCTGLSWQSDIANIMGRAYNRMGVNPNLRYSVPILLP